MEEYEWVNKAVREYKTIIAFGKVFTVSVDIK